ncbi:MAG: hypothetical protein F4X83_05770 [Chloroflexi bacterium]|nr:hypothetical protein [Chloroflexota bacterium]
MSKLKALAGLGVMLLALMLTGCSGEPSPTDTPVEAPTVAVASTSVVTPTPVAVDTPTPVAQVQEGAALTTREYAEALVEATSGFEEEGDDKIEAAFEALFSGDLISEDVLERMFTLETSESWSEDDVKFASEFAKTLLQATTAVYDVILKVFNEYLDEMASLKPPEHLSDLHSAFIEAYRESLRFFQEYVESVKNTDTEIKGPADYANFQEIVNSLESGPLDPELQQKSDDLAEQAEQACLELKEQLEAELERDVSICE